MRASIFQTRIVAGAALAAALLSSQLCQGQAGIPEAEAEKPAVAITLDGATLFQVRAIPPYSAEQRAQGINDRIGAVAADNSISIDELRVAESNGWSVISVGNLVLTGVADTEATAEGTDRKTLAERRRLRIAHALNAYRSERKAGVLLRATMYSAGATLMLLLLLLAGSRLFRRFHAAAERFFHAKMETTPFRPLHLIQADRSWKTLSAILHLLRNAAVLVSVFFFLTFVLERFPGTRHTAERLLTILLGPLRTMGKAVIESLPSLFFLLILALVTRYALTVIRLFFEATENRTVSFASFDRDWSMPTYRITRVLVIAFALVVAYPYMPGSNTDAFKGVTVFLGLMFSLSSSSAIANVIAGYALIYRRAYKVGDRVRIGDAFGDVTQIGQQATYLRSLKNEEIIIPNSEILKTSVINYSSMAKKPGLILHTTVGIGYETPWRQVEAMLLEAAQRTTGLLPEPLPFVLQTSLGDFAITYELNAYSDQPHASVALYSALHRSILDIFNEYGVQIMTPAYVADPPEPKVAPRDHQASLLPASATWRFTGPSGN